MGYTKFIRDLAKYLGVKCNVVMDMTTSEVRNMAREKKLPPSEIRLQDKEGNSTLLFTLGRAKPGRR